MSQNQASNRNQHKGSVRDDDQKGFFRLRKRVRDFLVIVLILNTTFMIVFGTGFFGRMWEYIIGTPPEIQGFLVTVLTCTNVCGAFMLRFLDQ